MAAPSGTQWGSVNGSGTRLGRIGLYVTTSSSQTSTTVTVQIWYWTMYSVSDSANTFYYDWDGYANTSIGSKKISHTVSTGAGWSTSNQTRIGTYSKSFNRGTSNSTGQFSARFVNIEYGGGSGTAVVSFSIPARNRYSISYNANGGSGAPSTQYYYYGYNTSLSSIRPTRVGYNFIGWSSSSTSTKASYKPGQAWSGTNAGNYTLYAVWERKVYNIIYDAGANGGEFDNEQTQISKSYTHGSVLGGESGTEIPIPHRNSYKFIGWNTKQDGTGIMVSSDTIVDGNATLYAIYEIVANCYIMENGKYVTGMMYIKVGGVYKTGVIYVKQNGIYKRTIIDL